MAQPKEVKRYRAGQRPLWDQDPSKSDKSTQRREASQREKPIDRRLARLEHETDVGDEQERLNRHRRIVHEAAVLVGETSNLNEPALHTLPQIPVDENEDIEKRRERARKMISDRDGAAAAGGAADGAATELPVEPDDDGENEQESSSVSEEEDDEDDWDQLMPSKGPRIQPRFVKKDKRQTGSEQELLQLELDRAKEEKERLAKERKERTRILLKETIERERAAKSSSSPTSPTSESTFMPPDDDDEETQQKEYELWKLRELVRIRRERDDRERWRIERLETERRSVLTDEEVAAEKRKNKENFKERKFMKYLQKYYHKGAFYSEELRALPRTHDWTAATGEDQWVDRTMLPKVMQVKNFGRAGRTKYTHLKNEDTSRPDDPWAAAAYNPQYVQKMGGTGGFERPSKKRKISS